jgi:hypothetical protein
MERWWNDTDSGKTEVRGEREICLIVTLSTTAPTPNGLKLNPGPHGERPVTNRLIHGTALRDANKKGGLCNFSKRSCFRFKQRRTAVLSLAVMRHGLNGFASFRFTK